MNTILVGSCAKEFKEISPIHTACLAPSINLAKRGLSRKEAEQIVDLHNRWRRTVDVPAAAMQKMVSLLRLAVKCNPKLCISIILYLYI